MATERDPIFSGTRHDHPGRKGMRMAPPKDVEGAMPVPHVRRLPKTRMNAMTFLNERLNMGESMDKEDVERDSQYYEFISYKQEKKELKQWVAQRMWFERIKKSLRKRHRVAS